MSTLDHLHHEGQYGRGPHAEGWYALRHRAAHALTHFTPTPAPSNAPDVVAETAEEEHLHHAARWALLPADMAESSAEVTVRLEVPGAEPDRFEIEVTGEILTVRGQKEAEDAGPADRYYLLERAYGAFERTIHLPATVDPDRAAARYRNGVLTITLPKRNSVHLHRISIRSD